MLLFFGTGIISDLGKVGNVRGTQQLVDALIFGIVTSKAASKMSPAADRDHRSDGRREIYCLAVRLLRSKTEYSA